MDYLGGFFIMNKVKKSMIGLMTLSLLLGSLTGCGGAGNDTITVVSREDGSVQEEHLPNY